jgi:sporulation protein YlmC with PRC-barrel domain
MEQRLHSMLGYTIHATDGELGKVYDFFFDEAAWTIRYMVVETGNWLSGRKVLISLVAMGQPDWDSKTVSVNLTCDQVRKSPDIDTEMPVYPRHEVQLHDYYDWPRYWGDGYAGTFGVTPFPLFESQELPDTEPVESGPHLRSIRMLTGCIVHATDGEIGHVKDFIVNNENWEILSLFVDTGSWLPGTGRKVVFPILWVNEINWDTLTAYITHSREDVQLSPGYKPYDL